MVSSQIISYFAVMAIILFDNAFRRSLLPFTYTKAVADIRFGICSVKERWGFFSQDPVYVHTDKYLQVLYPAPEEGEHLWIDAAVVPDIHLVADILSLKSGSCLADEKGIIAGKATIDFHSFNAADYFHLFKDIIDHEPVIRLEHPWQMMQWNESMLRQDYDWVIPGRISQPLPSTVNAAVPSHIFIEEGAELSYCTLNAGTGPIYIGKNAIIMEGSVIRGPFAMGENAVLKMNSRVYGATTLGPYCTGGGEIKNSVMMGYSNKAHDGYLGDSVVGEWCNFGAGSTNSNIKNTAGNIKIWDIHSNKYVFVGQKCGIMMGDYSHAAINSSINTGTLIGICCNVFGVGLLPTIIPNFSWGVNGTRYVFEKALADIGNWKKLKNRSLSEAEMLVLQFIFSK